MSTVVKPAASTNGEPALRTARLSKHWGTFVANDAVELNLPTGARHALIGPNGAGKTTLVNLLTGTLQPTTGDVYLRGQRITTKPQHQRVRLGLTRTFQINTLLPGLTVFDSVLLARLESEGLTGCWFRAVKSYDKERQSAWHLLEQLGLTAQAEQKTSQLAYGKQRLVEIALALATNPRVLLLDEPASGIPAEESQEVFEVLAALPRSVTLLFIEHDMNLVFRFAERVSVLVAGRLLLEGTAAQVAQDPQVRALYLGEEK